MKNVARKSEEREEGAQLRLVTLKELVHQELRAFVVGAGMHALAALLEEERTSLCGPRYRHHGNRRAHRAGHVDGTLVMGGRRVTVKRPRVRTMEGEELALPSWQAFSVEDPLHERALTQMLMGVSTRKYKRSLEPVEPQVKVRGTSKSAVSRRFVAITEAQMNEWFHQDLSAIDMSAIFIDGVHIGEHVMLVALGIDVAGTKHVLGIREGSTENARVCTDLLTDLRERGLSTEKTTLFVLDGSKAIRKAVLDVFGGKARIQRCQVHKMRNVLEQVPEYMRGSVKAMLAQAYASSDVGRARKLLQNLTRTLRADHPSAAASVEEGLEETLTVMAMKLPRALERTLSTTNAIENLIGSVRGLSARVKRWRDGQMIVRWTATAVREASTRFRRIRGYKDMSKLLHLLRAHDAVEQEANIM